MEEVKYQYRRANYAWCRKCSMEVPSAVCFKCGGTYMGGWTDPFAVVREEWVEVPVVWWKPGTWFGGYWKVVGVK